MSYKLLNRLKFMVMDRVQLLMSVCVILRRYDEIGKGVRLFWAKRWVIVLIQAEFIDAWNRLGKLICCEIFVAVHQVSLRVVRADDEVL